jgi:hypothetical protein
MKLGDIKFEDFAEIIGMIDDQPGECQQFYLEAMAEVPLIERLMDVYNHAAENGAPEIMLKTNKTIISTLTALFLLEKKAEASETEG